MDRPPRSVLQQAADAAGSLKITVVTLIASIYLVFVGTLAQVDAGIWTVMDRYFRCWVAWVEWSGGTIVPLILGVLAWTAFLRQRHSRWWFVPPVLAGGVLTYGLVFANVWKLASHTQSFPFPGGKLLGAILVVNMLVSHAQKIRVTARGGRLAVGLATLAVGLALTWIMISHVFDLDSTQGTTDPFWRVTIQLLQGGGAAIVLFMGCWMVFGRKAGIVLLHFGVILLMVSELVTAGFAKEAMMSVHEGQTINFVEDTRTSELAIVDGSDPAADDVVVVPASLLRKGGRIPLPGLPFDVEVAPGAYMKNANLREPKPGEANRATHGLGLRVIAEHFREGAGVDTSAGTDEPAVYATFVDKATGAPLGTYLGAVRLAHQHMTQTMKAGGKEYAIALRFERVYKPYSVTLHDFQFKRYLNTDKPKDFSSYIRLDDPERGVSRDVRVWMNNPLRYRGDTLYQADWDKESEAGTVLQVVENRGWMVPYVACMIVAVGLLGQFLLHLMGFLREREARR